MTTKKEKKRDEEVKQATKKGDKGRVSLKVFSQDEQLHPMTLEGFKAELGYTDVTLLTVEEFQRELAAYRDMPVFPRLDREKRK
jgi:hypothetical protein